MGVVREIDALSRDYINVKKQNNAVASDIDNAQEWMKLIDTVEKIEPDGLTRNSDPVMLQIFRVTMDALLAKYPLFFGYWIRYAEWEFRIAGTEAAEYVYERAVGAIPNAVDLWVTYCSFKMNTCHDSEIIRSLFERAIQAVILDINSSQLWDKYIEYEERMDAQQNVLQLLFRAIHCPSSGNQDHINRLRQLAYSRPLADLLSPEDAQAYLGAPLSALPNPDRPDIDERKLRQEVDAYYYTIFYGSQTEFNKRKQFEDRISRPYFTTDDVDEAELNNWKGYLDFEEAQGDFSRTAYLYERCLVPCACYDLMWTRYYRWMRSVEGKEEEVRNIFRRACCIYIPTSRPDIRLCWARWEESLGNVGTANSIYNALVESLPNLIEAVVASAHLNRRHYGLEAALDVYREYIGRHKATIYSKGWIVAEWATMLWTSKADAEQCREVFVKSASHYLDVKKFWLAWFQFELEVPTPTEAAQTAQMARVAALVARIRSESRVPPTLIRDICAQYMAYLDQRGGPDAMRELVLIDTEINGPFSVQAANKRKLAADGTEESTNRRLYIEAGHPGVPVNDPLVRRGENPYASLYREQGEDPYVAGVAREALRISR